MFPATAHVALFLFPETMRPLATELKERFDKVLVLKSRLDIHTVTAIHGSQAVKTHLLEPSSLLPCFNWMLPDTAPIFSRS